MDRQVAKRGREPSTPEHANKPTGDKIKLNLAKKYRGSGKEDSKSETEEKGEKSDPDKQRQRASEKVVQFVRETEQIKVSLPISIFKSSIVCQKRRENTIETSDDDDVKYVKTERLSPEAHRQRVNNDLSRYYLKSAELINKVDILLKKDDSVEINNNYQMDREEMSKLHQSIHTVAESTKQHLEDINGNLKKIEEQVSKNMDRVCEALDVISKHIVLDMKDNSKRNDHQTDRNLESPTTTVDISFEDEILLKAEQFSEQNKAELAKKAQQEKAEKEKLEANLQMLAKKQVTKHQQMTEQTSQKHIETQLNKQHQSQMSWQEKEKEVRQQIANYYQQQQNARLAQHNASQVEQHILQQCEERSARSQDPQQSQHITEPIDQRVARNEQLVQQKLVEQHEQLRARHNEQVAKHNAQLAKQAEMANRPIINMENMVVSDYVNPGPTVAKDMPDQRVLRPRPTPQVVLHQHPFVQPKQKAPRKLSAKQIRERRASVQCEPSPTPQPSPYYPHLPTMRVPTQDVHTAQRNARLAEENFQKQQSQAYSALQNQAVQQQATVKAAKLRGRRASCQPSLTYLDQGYCHEMLRQSLTNAQTQNMNIHDQSNFYPQPMRYFASTPQPGTSADYTQYSAQNPGIASQTVGLNLSVNNADQGPQNLSKDPADWMRGRSASITRIPCAKR